MATEDACSWCEEAEWILSCAMCDPRRPPKKLCAHCTTLWHARGYAKQHTLITKDGVERTYERWAEGESLNEQEEAVADEGEPGRKLSLGELLANFSEDEEEMEKLMEHVQGAIAIVDAICCVKFAKCKQPECLTVVDHISHLNQDRPCQEEGCRQIGEYLDHEKNCIHDYCHFCVRVKQRRHSATNAALDHVISELKTSLRVASGDADKNFRQQQLSNIRRRQTKHEEAMERLNRVVREAHWPIFNFPAFQWHFDQPYVKREVVEEDQPQQEPSYKYTNETEAKEEIDFGSAEDRIRDLISHRSQSDEAQQEFEQVLRTGLAIVDSTFCSHAKASRCRLDCHQYLEHMQHHLDLNVCHHPTCASVEYHFRHITSCKAAEQEDDCEYCLKITEREYVRAVEQMTREHPAARARVQGIMDQMKTSMEEDTPQEHEIAMIQLQDELDQVTTNKRELEEKLEEAKQNLRLSRDKMKKTQQTHGRWKTSSIAVPPHFVEVKSKK